MSNVSVTFDLGSLFSRSWEVYKKNVGPLLGAIAIVYVILIFGGLALRLVVRLGPLGGLLIVGPLQLGMFKMVRQALRDEPVDFNLLFSGFSRFPDAYLAGLLIGLFSFVGAVFCIIPGLFVGLMYMLTYLFMLDDKLAFWDAMEASRKMVMNNPGQWILLWLALCLFNILGMLACCVGIIVTGPVSLLIITLAYDAERRAGAVVPPVVEPTA